MLELRAISKSFDRAPALASIDLVVPSGRTTVLIGPSGSGKSTLLRLMMGLIRADRGTVRFDAQEVTPATAPLLRRRMGYVIQSGGLFPHLTARGNIALMARYLGWDGARIAARVEALAALTRFPADGLDRYPAQLSGGQRQRVGLMRALMLDPDVLMLDEPLGALDPIIRRDLQTELKEIFAALGKTVVLVTHDIGEAGYFGDLIVLLQGGRIVQQGTLAELLERPADGFVERFITAQRSLLDQGGRA
ncbi:MAG TPA: ATP-binding cassette domain-containing protein [Alphaproteobacteria bacterium]|nr:ATP-binding cassette domain-containing protein [Alphaproteobacteria bacterium]